MSGDALLEKLRHVTVYLTGDADAKLYTVQPNPPSFSYSGTPNCWSHFLNFKIWQLFELKNTVWPISRYNTVQISKRGDPQVNYEKKCLGKNFKKSTVFFTCEEAKADGEDEEDWIGGDDSEEEHWGHHTGYGHSSCPGHVLSHVKNQLLLGLTVFNAWSIDFSSAGSETERNCPHWRSLLRGQKKNVVSLVR